MTAVILWGELKQQKTNPLSGSPYSARVRAGGARDRRTVFLSERHEWRMVMMRVIEHLIAAIEALLYPERRRSDRKC